MSRSAKILAIGIISFFVLGAVIVFQQIKITKLEGNKQAKETTIKKQHGKISELEKKVGDLTEQIVQEALAAVSHNKAIEMKHDSVVYRISMANQALCYLADTMLKKKKQPELTGRINAEKTELKTGDWILFNLKPVDSGILDQKGFVRPERIKGCLKYGVFIHASEYCAWIYCPEEQMFYRRDFKKIIPQQNIVLLSWEK